MRGGSPSPPVSAQRGHRAGRRRCWNIASTGNACTSSAVGSVTPRAVPPICCCLCPPSPSKKTPCIGRVQGASLSWGTDLPAHRGQERGRVSGRKRHRVEGGRAACGGIGVQSEGVCLLRHQGQATRQRRSRQERGVGASSQANASEEAEATRRLAAVSHCFLAFYRGNARQDKARKSRVVS